MRTGEVWSHQATAAQTLRGRPRRPTEGLHEPEEETARSAPTLRIALVHDFLVDLRGAERVFLELCEMWPQAPIFTAVYDEEGTEGQFAGRDVRTTFLQRLRPSARNFRNLFPLYPSAIESLDFLGHDLIVSSSSAWAHGIVGHERAVHVCYCHNPFRYAWNDYDGTIARRRDPVSRAALRASMNWWRRWDQRTARSVDRYIANSQVTQARIRNFYGRDSRVVYPPVRTDRFVPGPVGDHYVVLSELMPHKMIDDAIHAFNKLRRPLVVIGDGPAYKALRRIAGPTVTLTGRVPDQDVERLLQTSRALICTAVEEFGIAAVESQAAGRPVIARAEGGLLETVIDGVTGCFWVGGADELCQAVLGFEDAAIDPQACLTNARRFGVSSFRKRIRAEIREAVDASQTHRRPRREPLATTRWLSTARV